MPRHLLIGVALLLPACTYDLDKIYENESDGADPDEPLPNPLIGLWEGQVEDACASCARSECAAANTACRDDPQCGQLTRCAATSTDPSTLDRCRSEQVSWLAENPSGRTLGGPYYSCVFRDLCADKCGTHTDLACLGDYDWSNSGVNSITATFQFMNALGLVNPDMLEPATDLTVKVCSGIDVECATGSTQSTDAEGKVSLVLPTPLGRTFTGYIDVAGGDWYPTLVKLAYPVARPATVFMPIVDKESIAANALLSGVQPDTTRGQLQIRMFGCGGIGVRGISFEASAAMIDEATRTWYASRDGFPVFETTATSDLGSGGIINVKAGFPEITARRMSDGVVVARARAPVRAGYLTIVVLAPLDSSQ